jgi:alkaline phosphatase
MFARVRLRLTLSLLLLLAAASFSFARPEADCAILFIGDGMGPNQVAMTGLAKGSPLTFQRFPYSGTVTTIAVDGETTDSAAAGTALATGAKTKDGMLGVNPGGQRLETILERSLRRGKSAGIISNDSLWGATPASFAAHAASRGESSLIAAQVAKSGAMVMLGTGKAQFLPVAAGGKRSDSLNLVDWVRRSGYDVVYDRKQLLASQKMNLVGLFEDESDGAPRLVDCVKAALVRLNGSRRGFFLIVEQARVDWEPGDPAAVQADILELEEAVAAAQEFGRERGRTLVVVTSDHETGGCMIDDSAKVAQLRGMTGRSWQLVDRLNKERTNVAEVLAAAGIANPTPEEIAKVKEAKDASAAIGGIESARIGVRWTSDGEHTKTPVRVFAWGPGADRFTGALDNTQIPAKIAEALGIGPIPAR